MSRYCLVAGGIDFDDEFSKGFPATEEDKAKWVALGKNTTTNVPMIVNGDKVYTQSTAVVRVAARMAGLYPKDDEESYECDNITAAAGDLRAQAYKSLPMFGASEEAVKNYVEKAIPLHAGNLQRILGDNEYFVGGKLSYADIVVYDVLTNNCNNMVPGSLDAFPKLDAFRKRIDALPKIAEYIKSEKFTKLMAFPDITKKKE